MKVTKVAERLGIDIGKNVFYLFGVDAQGTPVLRKKLRRGALLEFLVLFLSLSHRPFSKLFL